MATKKTSANTLAAATSKDTLGVRRSFKDAKRADPVQAKVIDKKPLKKADTIAKHEVKNVGQLRTVLADYPSTCKFELGAFVINVLNLRGRKVAEISPAVTK
jgi:hypothetical protein